MDIHQNGMIIKGKIAYENLTPIDYNIMGPFSLLPFIDCNHAIHSLYHSARGTLQAGGSQLDFSTGRGYIEQDWGRSFPQKYSWLQTSDFPNEKTCLFLSVAKVPVLGRPITGCICILYFNQKEYRLATYLGVKIVQWTQKTILLNQGKYTLQIFIQNSIPQKLLAPSKGELTRAIHESTSCQIHIVFHCDGRRLFEQTSEAASFEYVE